MKAQHVSQTATTDTSDVSGGLFIAIEGTDGSGKGTQFELLTKKLQDSGYDVATFDFPEYDKEASYFVRQYLNGVYGSAEDVGPYTASLFFALNRFDAAQRIREALNQGKVVLTNRFTASNMAHQGGKFANPAERRGFFVWLDNLEHQMLGVPRPNKSIILRVPAEVAQNLVDQKAKRSYTDKKRDIHEASLDHLQKSVEVYDDIAKLFPRDFQVIESVKDGQMLPIENIQQLLWQTVEPMLPAKPNQSSSAPKVPASKSNPYISKDQHGYYVTEQGKKWLQEAVTNVDGNVYATKSKIESLTAAAAMARLSRRGDDMRITILDEFAPGIDDNSGRRDEKLLQRVITAFGDDSVQQLVGQHIVVEGASNLLTKKLEWGRLASYLEQSTRYIYFDQRDRNGKFRYYTPKQLDEPLKDEYEASMERLFELYSAMVHELTVYLKEHSSVPGAERDAAWQGAIRAQACDAIRPVLPVATKSTVGIFGSGQAIESLIMHLMSDDLVEARDTGKEILAEARKVIATFLERADKPDRGGATIAYLANTRSNVKKLSKEYLPDNHSGMGEAVQLTSVWPRNELDLVPDMIYEHSSLPLKDIERAVDKWPYQKKLEVFQAYIGERLNRRHKPGRALEKAHYSWDLVCDYGIFRDLQRHRIVDDLEWQLLTPRYGYDIPELVETAGLSEQFIECFDISLQLYSSLQAGGFELEAQYATLLGHKMRWKVTYNAREAFHLHELRTSPQGHPGYRKLVLDMQQKVAEVHPLLADSMIFVNKGEDPELSRLAAERYTQFKLQQFDKD